MLTSDAGSGVMNTLRWHLFEKSSYDPKEKAKQPKWKFDLMKEAEDLYWEYGGWHGSGFDINSVPENMRKLTPDKYGIHTYINGHKNHLEALKLYKEGKLK
jgi:hypothetical protein